MSASGIRGGAGIAFAILGLLLFHGGPGFSVSSAATGCMDSPFCYIEAEEQGTVGPEGQFVASYTAKCQGNCNGGVEGLYCAEISQDNPDGTRSFQCSCDPDLSPPGCSGSPRVNGEGRVQQFLCIGPCGGAQCRPMVYNVVTDGNCPAGYSLNRRCVCE